MDQSQNQNQTSEENTYDSVDYYYTNFNGNNVSGSDPKGKSFDDSSGSKISYKEIPLTYNYATPENPIVDSLYFECPEVTCFGGIKSEIKEFSARKDGESDYVREKHSMMFTFNLQDSECVDCLGKWDELHKGTAQVLNKHKGKVGLYSFNPDHPGEQYKHPIYYKMDPNTCERIKGRNPTIWVKLNHWNTNKTLFTDVDENPIDWSLLKDVEIKLIPLLHIEKIYVGGGKASLQIKLVSAVVTDIVPINTRTRQTRTIDRLKKRKGLAQNVAAQLATLRMEKQDILDTGHLSQPQNATLPTGTMHQIPNQGNSTIHGSENLNDYLGAAPSMNDQTQPTQLTQQPLSVPSSSSVQFSTQPVQLNTQPPTQTVLQIN